MNTNVIFLIIFLILNLILLENSMAINRLRKEEKIITLNLKANKINSEAILLEMKRNDNLDVINENLLKKSVDIFLIIDRIFRKAKNRKSSSRV